MPIVHFVGGIADGAQRRYDESVLQQRTLKVIDERPGTMVATIADPTKLAEVPSEEYRLTPLHVDGGAFTFYFAYPAAWGH